MAYSHECANYEGKAALVEDENTVHWLYSYGSVPAVAIVCGLAKSF